MTLRDEGSLDGGLKINIFTPRERGRKEDRAVRFEGVLLSPRYAVTHDGDYRCRLYTMLPQFPRIVSPRRTVENQFPSASLTLIYFSP